MKEISSSRFWLPPCLAVSLNLLLSPVFRVPADWIHIYLFIYLLQRFTSKNKSRRPLASLPSSLSIGKLKMFSICVFVFPVRFCLCFTTTGESSHSTRFPRSLICWLGFMLSLSKAVEREEHPWGAMKSTRLWAAKWAVVTVHVCILVREQLSPRSRISWVSCQHVSSYCCRVANLLFWTLSNHTLIFVHRETLFFFLYTEKFYCYLCTKKLYFIFYTQGNCTPRFVHREYIYLFL